jgi:hypothetical protein
MNLEEYENQLVEDKHEEHTELHTRILQHIDEHRDLQAAELSMAGQIERDMFLGRATTPGQYTITGNGRQTGRTTKMILQALTAISNGKRVYIIAPTYGILDNIHNKLSISAQYLGLADFTYLIRYVRPHSAQVYSVDREQTLLLYDHTCSEYDQR